MNAAKLDLLSAFCLRELNNAQELGQKLTAGDFAASLHNIALDGDIDPDSLGVSLLDFETTLLALEKQEQVFPYRHAYAKSRFVITEGGHEAWLLPQINSATDLFKELEELWLLEALVNIHGESTSSAGNQSIAIDTLQIKDEDWEPLPIDRNDHDTTVVVAQLEEALTAVKQDNGYAANLPEEREYVVQSLNLTIEWLQTKQTILVLTIKRWAIEPLTKAAVRFGPSVVGAAVTLARELLVAWLKKKLIGG